MAAHRKHPPKNAAEEIERLAESGKSIIGIAKHFGVSKPTLLRWCEEDESLQEAFDTGKDAHKDYLVQLVTQAAIAGKGSNGNAMFLLKTMHGFREFDAPNNKTDVSIAVAQPVLVVVDHGTDEQWAAKVAEQQRKLTIDASTPAQLQAPQCQLEQPEYPWTRNESAAPVPARPEPSCEAPAWKPRR
jgi:hypothetical protein